MLSRPTRPHGTLRTLGTSSFYSECGNVIVSSNSEGYMTVSCTTTAGSAPSDSGDAPDSICPAGWRLPDYSPSEYSALLSEYGIGSGFGQNPNGELNTAPLYFVPSGYVYPSNHYLYYAGNNGYYWYGRASNSSSGNTLGFYSTSVYPASGNSRYLGLSVRCIAPSA